MVAARGALTSAATRTMQATRPATELHKLRGEGAGVASATAVGTHRSAATHAAHNSPTKSLWLRWATQQLRTAQWWSKPI